MHKYEELERLYYKKKYTKYFFIFFIIAFLSALILFFSKSFNKSIQKNNKINLEKKIEKKETNKTVKEVIIPKKETKEINKTKVKKIKKEVKKLVLYPIFPELNENKEKIKQIKKQQIKKQIVPKIEVSEVNKEKKENKIALKIVVKSAKTTNDLIYIFEKSPTYQNAIKISKIYFERKNYQKAIEWSKKANKIEPEDYESWYIFAKSLIKLGKVDKAKKVLIAYLNTYGPDKNIEELLRSIK